MNESKRQSAQHYTYVPLELKWKLKKNTGIEEIFDLDNSKLEEIN